MKRRAVDLLFGFDRVFGAQFRLRCSRCSAAGAAVYFRDRDRM
jgi:hypothetical protein